MWLGAAAAQGTTEPTAQPRSAQDTQSPGPQSTEPQSTEPQSPEPQSPEPQSPGTLPPGTQPSATRTPSAQNPEPLTPQGPVELSPDTVAALERLATLLAQLRADRAAALAAGDAARVTALDERLAEQQGQFTMLAARLTRPVLDEAEPAPSKFDVQKELEQLVRPLLRALKDATAGPRRIDEMAARLEAVTARRQDVQRAANALLATRDALPAGSAARAEADRQWQDRVRPLLEDLGSEMLVLTANVKQLREDQQPFVTTVTDNVRRFVENSGLNLVLSVLVFLAVFFGLRFVGDAVLRRRRQRGFSMRLAAVLVHGFTVLAAVAATLVVPYARNDWFLLAVGIVFLLGAGWVLVRMAPQFFEQIRLMLNIGAVREGERILVRGLPFRVDSLRFYSLLVNPELSGGTLRVPIKDLIEQRSRPVAPDEPWFPCRTGDVVALEDGVIGRVRLQTPDVVVVVERHDAPKSYPTAAFLQRNPRNLSAGFEVVVRFGLDYRHQPDALTTVPQALRDTLANGLAVDSDPGEVRELRVELAAAGRSSLDYEVVVGFAGSAAVRYHELVRRVQGLLVGACTAHGFGIPFPQLTVHGAPPAAAAHT